MEFKDWMTENFKEHSLDKTFTFADMQKAYEYTYGLLSWAYDHLKYCNFGDSWERECSSRLRDELTKFFAEE